MASATGRQERVGEHVEQAPGAGSPLSVRSGAHGRGHQRPALARTTPAVRRVGLPFRQFDLSCINLAHQAPFQLPSLAVSDHRRLGHLSQFNDSVVLAVRKCKIQKRRDGRVVDGARLKSEARQPHQATPTRVNAHAISGLTFKNDHSVCVRKPRCCSSFEPHVSQSYHTRLAHVRRVTRCSFVLVVEATDA